MSRFHAASYHFLISLGIFLALAYLVLVHWYPDFFFAIDGGWEGMRIIIGVDLVMGPLLTLVVFKAGKPGLWFDLTCIALLQLGCLAAGVYVVYDERPTFFVYYEGHFYSNSADTYIDYGIIPPDPAAFGDTTPVYQAAILSDDPIEEANLRRVLYQTGTPGWLFKEAYQPLANHMADVVDKAATAAEVRAKDVDGNLAAWLESHGGDESDYGFVPIHSRYRNAYIGIRLADQSFVDIVEIRPPAD